MCVLILPPCPVLGGTIGNPVVRLINDAFYSLGFNTLRINFRGVGMSKSKKNERTFDIQDALDALDWLATKHQDPRVLCVAGFGYGAYLAIHIAMRTPRVHMFVAATPYSMNGLDFNVLTPCPNGLILVGEVDQVANPELIKQVSGGLSSQKGSSIVYRSIPEASHTYQKHRLELGAEIVQYASKVLDVEVQNGFAMAAG